MKKLTVIHEYKLNNQTYEWLNFYKSYKKL